MRNFVLGILGTLVGITVAIGSLAPADSGLTEVTGGLAVAIDTTAVALAESVLLVFAYFFVKRQEETLLGDIEHRSLLDFGRLLTSPAADHPFIQAEAEAAQDLMQRTEVLIKAQTGYWQDSVDHLRLRWQETIADQQQHLAANLAQGVQSTLQDHHGQLVDVRQEFLQTYREVTRKFEETLATAEERRQRQDEQLRANWEEFCQRLGRDLQSAREMHTSEASQLLDGVTRRIDQWQDQLRDATETSQKQLVELTRQGTLLARVVIREEQLAGLQQRLTDNLQAVREAAGFDDTLHSLNAAVHLLTARVRRAA